MKIVVCVEAGPGHRDPRQDRPRRERRSRRPTSNWIVSPYDEFAIEEALRIKEAKGGEVVLVTVGPERAQAALRTGLAMGADSAVHVKDPALDAADTARHRAGAGRGDQDASAPFDLVLCGQQGVGGDDSQVPGMLAELLDLPQVTVAVKLEIGDGKATVEREIEGARETWETPLPAVISAQKGLNEPRYASLKGIMAAKKKPIQVLDAGGAGPGRRGGSRRSSRVTRAWSCRPPRPAGPHDRGRPGRRRRRSSSASCTKKRR